MRFTTVQHMYIIDEFISITMAMVSGCTRARWSQCNCIISLGSILFISVSIVHPSPCVSRSCLCATQKHAPNAAARLTTHGAHQRGRCRSARARRAPGTNALSSPLLLPHLVFCSFWPRSSSNLFQTSSQVTSGIVQYTGLRGHSVHGCALGVCSIHHNSRAAPS